MQKSFCSLTDFTNLGESEPFVTNNWLKFEIIICNALEILNLHADLETKINYMLINMVITLDTSQDFVFLHLIY